MKIVQCKNLIGIWNKRQLTIYGKILVIKSILLPNFTYSIQACVVTKHVTKQNNLLLFKFLWGGKNQTFKKFIDK